MIFGIAAVIKLLIFLFLFIFSFCTVKLCLEKHLLRRSVKSIYGQLKKKEFQRVQAEERLRYEDGRQEKEKFLTKISMLIVRSNLNQIFPFISTEIYLFGTLVIALAVFLVTQSIFNLVTGILSAMLVILFSYMVLYFLSGHNYKKSEKSLLNFANLLENYSKTTDDIIGIFQKVLPYIENPIRDALEECCTKAFTTGKVSASLNELANKIEHEKFRELIRNLEICSRYEANYAEIITESKQNLREYMAAKEKRKEMQNNCKINIAIILFAGVFILNMISGMGQTSVFSVLMGSLIGNLIIVYCVLILGAVLFMFFSIDK